MPGDPHNILENLRDVLRRLAMYGGKVWEGVGWVDASSKGDSNIYLYPDAIPPFNRSMNMHMVTDLQ